MDMVINMAFFLYKSNFLYSRVRYAITQKNSTIKHSNRIINNIRLTFM